MVKGGWFFFAVAEDFAEGFHHLPGHERFAWQSLVNAANVMTSQSPMCEASAFKGLSVAKAAVS